MDPFYVFAYVLDYILSIFYYIYEILDFMFYWDYYY